MPHIDLSKSTLPHSTWICAFSPRLPGCSARFALAGRGCLILLGAHRSDSWNFTSARSNISSATFAAAASLALAASGKPSRARSTAGPTRWWPRKSQTLSRATACTSPHPSRIRRRSLMWSLAAAAICSSDGVGWPSSGAGAAQSTTLREAQTCTLPQLKMAAAAASWNLSAAAPGLLSLIGAHGHLERLAALLQADLAEIGGPSWRRPRRGACGRDPQR